MKIAITGIGIVSAIGRNCSETLESLLEQRSGIGTMRFLGSAFTDFPVGEVPFSNAELRQLAGIGEEPLPRTSLLGIIAALEALEMAKGNCDAFINGTTVGGMDLTEQHWLDYKAGKATENILLHEAGETTKAILRHLPNDQMVNVITPSTACSAALNAIICGAEMLRTYQAKRVLVGGAESLSLFHFNGFRTLQIMDKTPCRPFDATRKGLNLGEGAGYLVLEREEDALSRGAKILGYIGGYANTCDAYHQTASSPDGTGAFLAMQNALTMAGLQPSDIDYVNAHGTATENNDSSESAALKRLFGEALPAISSTKAFTGHTTSASGGIEAVICVLAMNHGFIPANLHWTHAEEGLITPVTQTRHQPVHHVLCNAFGFGGNESALVLSDHSVELNSAEINEPRLLETADASVLRESLVTSVEARRMTPQMRMIVSVVRKALLSSGIAQPDAIICATRWGCLQPTMRFLTDMIETAEQELKPTPFIQSTHNTVASLMAILTGNHGYNMTYSQGDRSLECALMDIRCQMALGRIRSALVLEFDEQVAEWDEVLALVGEQSKNIARAYIYVKNE